MEILIFSRALTLLLATLGLASAQICDQSNVQFNFGTDSNVPQRPCVPTLAYDQSSIWLVWNKPDKYSSQQQIVDYNVYTSCGCNLGSASANAARHSAAAAYINNFYKLEDKKAGGGSFHVKIGYHSFLVTGLKPNTSYSFTVRAVDSQGQESADSAPVTGTTAPDYAKVVNVKQFGAKCDGATVETAAIQAAINNCANGSASAYGCKLVVPAGDACVSGSLALRSNMTLEIEEGGTLKASTNASDFPGEVPLLFANYKLGAFQNIRITGTGTIDGSGWKLDSTIVDELEINKLPVYAKGSAQTVLQLGVLAANQVAVNNGTYGARSTLVKIGKATNVYIGGVRVLNPSKDTIKIEQNSANIVLANTRLQTYNVNNGDGMGISSSQNALIFNNFFNTGDDCIATNAGLGLDGQKNRKPVQYIWVFNNYFREGHGAFVVGSQTAAWMQDILVEDNVLFRTDNGLRLKSSPATGGGARRIVFRDTAMLGVGVMQGSVTLGGRDFPINQTDLGGQYTQSPFILTVAYTAGTAVSSPANQSAQFKDIYVRRVSVDNGKPGQGGSFITVDSYAGTDPTLSYPETFHSNLTFTDVKFMNVAPANISRLANSTFTNVVVTNWGNASSSPWNIRNSTGLQFVNVDPMPAGF